MCLKRHIFHWKKNALLEIKMAPGVDKFITGIKSGSSRGIPCDDLATCTVIVIPKLGIIFLLVKSELMNLTAKFSLIQCLHIWLKQIMCQTVIWLQWPNSLLPRTEMLFSDGQIL